MIGIDTGKVHPRQGVPIDPELVAKGIREGLSGVKLPRHDRVIQETMMAFQ
jgi:hypothetical protein